MGQQQKQGLVDTTVDGTMKSLPFGSGDVITQATMMVGDKVQFNIATKLLTKEEHAINIQIQPDTFQLESTEKRKIVSHLHFGVLGPLPDLPNTNQGKKNPVFFDLKLMDQI